ncbi:MAG: hypothetical protein ACKVOP_03190 [Sphingomonadaceae bacterium]
MLHLVDALGALGIVTSEAVLVKLVGGTRMNGNDIRAMAASTLALALVSYGVTEAVMQRRACSRHLPPNQRLPFWLYKWTANIAVDAADNALMTAFVVTTETWSDGHLAYSGPVDDLALDDCFNIERIVLVSCDRHAIDLSKAGADAIGRVLGTIPKLVIPAASILNVSFDRVNLPPVAVPLDLLAQGLIRLYATTAKT